MFREELDHLLEEAGLHGATHVHLAVHTVPLFRMGDGDLLPLPEFSAPLTDRQLSGYLSCHVDPDHWDQIEAAGEGEAMVSVPGGRRHRLTFFRSTGSWRLVIHLK